MGKSTPVPYGPYLAYQPAAAAVDPLSVQLQAAVTCTPALRMAAPVSIALVGCGDIFSHHLAAILEHPNLFHVTCLCDPDETRRATAAALIVASVDSGDHAAASSSGALSCFCPSGSDEPGARSEADRQAGVAFLQFATLTEALAAEGRGEVSFTAVRSELSNQSWILVLVLAPHLLSSSLVTHSIPSMVSCVKYLWGRKGHELCFRPRTILPGCVRRWT
eukprot:SAG11_NODE_413_length_9694_cov_2.695675_3_plen_220_part_00